MTRTLSYVPILADDLRALNACQEQVERFDQLFPCGATPDHIDAAVAAGLDVEWLACVLDPAPYDAAEAEAERVYGAAKTEAWRVYGAAKAEAWRVYDAAKAEAWRVYDAAKAEAGAAILRACWPVWEGDQ